VTLERPVNVGVTVILSWSGFSIVTKEMGRTRSSPAFSYYTGITPPMTILPSSPTVKGFTANNLRGSVRYWSRPPARALGDLPQWLARQAAMTVGLTHASAASVYRSGSRRARRLARRLARIASARDRPGGLPGGSLVSLRRMV